MKTSFKNYLVFGSLSMFILLSACHSRQKDSSAVADSINQKQDAQTDSASRAQVAASDSVNLATTALRDDASKFLVKSYEAGMYEIQLSQLAATNAVDGDVKNLASAIATDHTAINANITAIAAGANFVLPNAIDADHQKALQDIAKLKGADFDKKYVNTIADDYEKAVSDYKDAYKHFPASNTKNFAGETLPKIQDHLAMARKVKDRIK